MAMEDSAHWNEKAAQTVSGLYSLISNSSKCHFVTRNTTLLFSVFLVFTSTVPVVAPDGMLVSISDPDTTLNSAAVSVKVTLVRTCQIRAQDSDGRSNFA